MDFSKIRIGDKTVPRNADNDKDSEDSVPTVSASQLKFGQLRFGSVSENESLSTDEDFTGEETDSIDSIEDYAIDDYSSFDSVDDNDTTARNNDDDIDSVEEDENSDIDTDSGEDADDRENNSHRASISIPGFKKKVYSPAKSPSKSLSEHSHKLTESTVEKLPKASVSGALSESSSEPQSNFSDRSKTDSMPLRWSSLNDSSTDSTGARKQSKEPLDPSKKPIVTLSEHSNNDDKFSKNDATVRSDAGNSEDNTERTVPQEKIDVGSSEAYETSESLSEADDNFDDLFEDLLDGDESVSIPSDGKSDGEEFSGNSVDVAAVASSTPHLNERDAARREARRARGGESRGRRNAKREKQRVSRYSQSTTYKKSRKGLESDIARTSAVEYLVDESGVLIQSSPHRVTSAEEFDKLAKAAESHSAVNVSESFASLTDDSVVASPHKGKVIYPWSKDNEVAKVDGELKRDKKKMNPQELDFYRNLQAHKNSFLSDPHLTAALRPDSSLSNAGSTRAKKTLAKIGTTGHKGYSRKAGKGITDADYELLHFLARFKYGNIRQLSRIRAVSEITTQNRLKRLKEKGLVDSMSIWGTQPLWFLTSAGMLLSGYDLPMVKPDDISYMLMPHQFVINNTAANLFGGNINVLNLTDFPSKNRIDTKGREAFGEVLVSESEIQSSLAKWKRTDSADIFRPKIVGAIEREFGEWERAGGVKSGYDSPEMLHGNEYMWTVFPSNSVSTLAYHVPDLVVKRPRNADGSPESIAVEIELDAKKKDRYSSTMKIYYNESRIFKKVIWVARSIHTARLLEETAKETGLWATGRIDIVPILTENGVFEGKELWTI